MEVVIIPYPSNVKILPKSSFDVVGKTIGKKSKTKVTLVARTENRLHFTAGELTFRIESAAFSGSA